MTASGSSELPGTFPTSRARLLNGAAPQATTGGNNPRGSNKPNWKHNEWLKTNWETLVPSNRTNMPVDVYIKLNRLVDQEGPVNLWARILIEYECEMSAIPIRTPFNNNVVTGDTVDGGDTGYIASSLTLGLARRFWMWGIPDVSSTPLQSGNLGYKESYQAATLVNMGKRRRAIGESHDKSGETSSKQVRMEDSVDAGADSKSTSSVN